MKIEVMLIRDLPDLQDTQSGKDLIRIGEERGREEGLEKAILLFLKTRHGSVATDLEEKIRALPIGDGERLLMYLYQPEAPSLDDVNAWLAGRHV